MLKQGATSVTNTTTITRTLNTINGLVKWLVTSDTRTGIVGWAEIGVVGKARSVQVNGFLPLPARDAGVE